MPVVFPFSVLRPPGGPRSLPLRYRVLLPREAVRLPRCCPFYYPLYQRVQQEWQGRAGCSSGRWRRTRGCRSPDARRRRSSIPASSSTQSYPHAWAEPLRAGPRVVAFGSMAALLRPWAIPHRCAAIGGLAYAFGGPVLFQYLQRHLPWAGRARRPWGLRAADRLVRSGDRRTLQEPAAVYLALQVLGGDAEAAYLTAALRRSSAPGG